MLKFAEIGHITGIQQSLEKLKKTDEQYLSFITKIEELLDNFQFKQIIKIINNSLQGIKQ